MDEEQKRVFREVMLSRLNRPLTLPNVIGVGAGRCGSSTLWRMLARSPDFYAPPNKELNFFGINQAPFALNGWTETDYATFFIGGENARYRLESSPAYLFRHESLRQIARIVPDVRILITLRDPVARFVSQYQRFYAEHGYSDINAYTRAGLARFGPASFTSTDWYSPDKNLAYSHYGEAVQTCFETFGAERCLVLQFEEMHRWQKALAKFFGAEICSPDEGRKNQSLKVANALDPSLDEKLREMFAASAAKLPNSY